MQDRIWDSAVEALIAIFLPLIASYHVFQSDLFFNVSAKDARGLEQIGNLFLTPSQYIFVGKEAQLQPDGSYIFVQRFTYEKAFWPRTAMCATVLPVSFVLGTTIKALGFIDSRSRNRHLKMGEALRLTKVNSNIDRFVQLGISCDSSQGQLISQGFQRRPGDETIMSEAKKLLSQVGLILTEEKIPWWIDCGTLLGAYRYGGIIPWDYDLDISIFAEDAENMKRALNRLDSKEFVLQDWSGRDFPNSLFKVYMRKTNQWIDIYTYAIDQQKKEISCIFSLEKNVFCFDSWKYLEKCFKRPVAFETVFPLKKGIFDGIEVFVPRDTPLFLQRYYGEDLSPIKVFNSKTGLYEKDLSHPYWTKKHAH